MQTCWLLKKLHLKITQKVMESLWGLETEPGAGQTQADVLIRKRRPEIAKEKCTSEVSDKKNHIHLKGTMAILF